MLYDQIGIGYAQRRRPDSRIAGQIHAALEGAATVVNVGAGAGSYEPVDRSVIAVEPSVTMIQQRPPGSALAVRAVAEDLPFRDASFDASLAVLTLHHWRDWRRGVRELRRVARRAVVIFTYDPNSRGFWLVQEYFPEFLVQDRAWLPDLEDLGEELGPLNVQAVPIPHDCSDGFLGAYWRRPRAYLDPDVRGGISIFAGVQDGDPRLLQLAADLEDGSWERRHGDLLELTALDIGYRLVVAATARTGA